MYIQTDTIAIHFQLHLLRNDEYRIQNHKIQENIAALQYLFSEHKRVGFVHFLVKRGDCGQFFSRGGCHPGGIWSYIRSKYKEKD